MIGFYTLDNQMGRGQFTVSHPEIRFIPDYADYTDFFCLIGRTLQIHERNLRNLRMTDHNGFNALFTSFFFKST